ncbi:hypothetical protein M885DRAFT_592644, partial [Pelagophyceae sp. CCMP2097]
MAALEADGVSFQCTGGGCNACRDKVPLEGTTHHAAHFLLVVADMLWLRMAQGYMTNVCPKCGYNSAEAHAVGVDGIGWPLHGPEYQVGVDESYVAAEVAYTAAQALASATAVVSPAVASPVVAAPGVAAPAVAAPGVAAPGVAAPGVAAPGVAAPGVAGLPFRKSGAFRAWQSEHPGHIGRSLLPFLSPLPDGRGRFHSDPLHMGLSLLPKEVMGTIVEQAVLMEADGHHGIERMLAAFRAAGLPMVARRIEYALKEVGAFNDDVKAQAHAGPRAHTKLVEQYVKGRSVPALRLECVDLGIPNKGNLAPKLRYDVTAALTAGILDGSISPVLLMSGDRLSAAAAPGDLVAGAETVVLYGVTMPQLKAILGGRIKMIGREVKKL